MNNHATAPPILHPGDKVGIVAPANKIDLEVIESAKEIITSWNLKVVLGKSLSNRHGTFAGTDQDRLHDFQQMLDDNEIKAIICARGGYGSLRILDQVNFQNFLQQPKWIIGYSDITAFHAAVYKLGFQSAHAIMPINFESDTQQLSINSLKNLLFDQPQQITAESDKLNKTGVGSGPIIGGNLAIICSQIGTPTDLDTSGKILFLEEIGEYLYHLDRMMIQLRRAQKLEGLNGLILGQFTNMKDNDIPFIFTLKEIIFQYVKDYDFPVGFNFDVGHEIPNYALPHGRMAELKVDNAGSRLNFL